jgi:glycosyltransferase involved in cell wall biosynthesis
MPSLPRLLFLCQTLPYPPDAGVSIRTYNVLRLLAGRFDITALCFYRRSAHPNDTRVMASTEALSRLARLEAFPIPQEHNRLRWVRDHLASVLTRRPYTWFAYDSRAFERRLRDLVEREHFDLVHMDSLDLSRYVPTLPGVPIVCVHHNVESRLLRSRASTAVPGAAAYLSLQARLTEGEERRWSRGFALNVTVSPGDSDTLRQIAPDARIATVPNGVDTSTFQVADGPENGGLVFVGGATWAPNHEAMDYFCREILPILRARGFSGTVTWVGSASDAVRKAYKSRFAVELTGYVNDIRPWVARASCFIVPLRAGGGTRLKILDAWAMGKAVVSTAVGCEGLEARDGENIIVRDTPETFATGILALLGDHVLRRRIGHEARRTAERTYDWQVIGRDMLRLYDQALADRRSRPRDAAASR